MTGRNAFRSEAEESRTSHLEHFPVRLNRRGFPNRLGCDSCFWPAKGAGVHARSLSVDLRRRVVGAIEGGLSCRAATQRFGVSASSAIRWRAQERHEGDIRPKLQGGDRHSQRIEPHAELILSAVDAKSDITPAELREQLEGARRRHRHRHTLAVLQASQDHAQKSRRTRPNSAAAR
jgi:transposase